MKKAISLVLTMFFVFNVFVIPVAASEVSMNQVLSDMEMKNAVGGSGEARVEIVYPTATCNSATSDAGYYKKADETCKVMMINSTPFDGYYTIELIDTTDDSVIWEYSSTLTLLDNETYVFVDGDFSTELDVSEYTSNTVLWLRATIYDGNGEDKNIAAMASRTLYIEGTGE